MGEETKRKIGDKLRDGWIWFDNYYSWGMGVYDKIKQPAMVMSLLGLLQFSEEIFLFFKIIPKWLLIPLVPGWFFGWFLVGLIWFKVLKIPQRDSVINGSRISDWEIGKMGKIDNTFRSLPNIYTSINQLHEKMDKLKEDISRE